MPSTDEREPGLEPVPFSETAGGHAPVAAPVTGDAGPPHALPPELGPQRDTADAPVRRIEGSAAERVAGDPLAGTSLGGPEAYGRASASPGPVPTGPALAGAVSAPASVAESDEALLQDLVSAHREARMTPAAERARAAAAAAGFEELPETPPPSLLRRFFVTYRHAVGLIQGAAVAAARDRSQFPFLKGLPLLLIRLAAFFVRPLVRRDLRDLPIQVQLRRRLELLGPTYIKLGQVLSLREDLLPRFITVELKNLLDKLPVMPFPRFLDRVAKGLGRPIEECFSWIDPTPLGSASIGQIHRARTVDGDDVILKVVKPHIYVVLKRDARLLGFFGSFLQVFFSRYQPKRILDEFTEYTLREVDLRREADNAEQLAMNFDDEEGIAFPRIYRAYSSRLVLTMERFDGIRPDSPKIQALPLEARERLVDLGAMSIIRMLYQDGFFHADLHPGNLFVLDTLPDKDGQVKPRIGFIDLGMVGTFDGELRRTLMYYYYSLVTGDAENAARYLTSVATTGPKSDPQGFKRAVAEICRRFYRAAKYGEFSLAQLVMESVSLGGAYRMYFPVELVLMTKALITFEGVGQALMPGFDVAKVSQRHVNRLFRSQFNPVALLKESFRGAPELVDLLIKSPTLAAEGLRFLEQRMRAPAGNPFVLRTALLSGSALIAGTVAASVGGPWFLWGPLFAVAALFALRRG